MGGNLPVSFTSSPVKKVARVMVSRELPRATLASKPCWLHSCAIAVVIALKKMRPTSCTCRHALAESTGSHEASLQRKTT